MCREEKGARGGGGPCVYRHWHVRHDEPVWLGSLRLITPPTLSALPPSLKLFSLSSCLTPSQHCPFCLLSCDLALSWVLWKM